MRKLILPVLILLSITGCKTTTGSKAYYYLGDTTQKQTTDNKQNIKAPTHNATLDSIITNAWQLNLAYSPELAASLGNKRTAGQLPDLSPESLSEQNKQTQQILNTLKSLDKSKLSKDEIINAKILQDQLQNQVDMYAFKDHYLPITAESGFHAYIASMATSPFNTADDYQHYLDKLAALPAYFAQQTFWLKQGLAAGITPAKVTLTGFEDSISAFIVPVEQSGYFKPFTTFPSHFTETQKNQFTQQGKIAISEKVLPVYQDFYDFMTQEYIPNARQQIAASALPDGPAFYQNRVEYYTTLPMTAEEVHQLGLTEVARIKTEMEQVITNVGYKGTFAEFLHFLRTDPQFYPKTAEELLKEAAYIAKKADAMLPKYFGKLPRTPYGIAPVPAEIAPKYTTGRYAGSDRDDQPGYYWVNTYALDKRPLYEMEALTLHEAVPGHHLQISLNKELTDLPNFRRYSYISAFGEGWGLYSEYLGLEAGFYQDPYSNFGRLTYEMWRAARLVVDTGMHAKGWSRQQAVDFMAGNTALSMHNVNTEIDRYISWPGQALSYKIGELTIKRLRAKAENTLGEKFNIREFHDAILENGSVPMPILEQMIDAYIAQKLS
ncbi:DUF885 domain-containing protein [Shewanella sp. HL-SH2]|uniref:DUF885 domain-containing protein n=1 Tax=Shewanella sp. HL-SH2 TaxID=3436238 RepID=UPI003EBF0726